MLGVSAAGPLAEDGVPGSSQDEHFIRDIAADERDAWAILSGVGGLGPVGFAALLSRFGSGREVLRIATGPRGVRELASSPPRPGPEGDAGQRPVPASLARAIADAAFQGSRALERIGALGLSVVTVADSTYPTRLAAIELPPHLLFVLGNTTALDPRHAVAVVGTRRPSDPGRAGRLVRIRRAGAKLRFGLVWAVDTWVSRE